jgi:hypothetical protein
MVIRRIVGTVLAAAALAGAVGVAIAPNAAAQPRSCVLLHDSVNDAQDQWLFYRTNYGDGDKKTIATRAAYVNAINKAVADGC